MNKLAIISNIPTLYTNNFLKEMRKNNFEVMSYFYKKTNSERNWDIEPDNKIVILENELISKHFKSIQYMKILINHLEEYKPSHLLIGGFSNIVNYLIYKWAKINNIKIIFFTELSRKNGVVRKKSLFTKLINHLYKNIDICITHSQESYDQFSNTFGFNKKVRLGAYPCDLSEYRNLPIRDIGKNAKIIFPNRLIDIYNPLFFIEIVKVVSQKYPSVKFYMNSDGDLRQNIKDQIEKIGVSDKIIFLPKVKKVEDLIKIYSEMDIMVLPAKFSNGNFTIKECMAAGIKLVISRNINGSGKFIFNKKNGFNLPLKVDEFVAAIETYLENNNTIKHAVINRRISNRFDTNKVAKCLALELKNLYEK